MSNLDKTILITGANSGVGYAMCRYFLCQGYNVIGVSRSTDNLQKLDKFNVSKEFIVNKLGVKTVSRMMIGEDTSDLCVKAYNNLKETEKLKNCSKIDNIAVDKAYELDLKIMDLTAFTLCKENKLPINVFNMNEKGNLLKVCEGKQVGTLINL